jgi:hypothetical protein
LVFNFLGAIYLFDQKGNKANAEDESHGIGVSRGAGCGGSSITKSLSPTRILKKGNLKSVGVIQIQVKTW